MTKNLDSFGMVRYTHAVSIFPIHNMEMKNLGPHQRLLFSGEGVCLGPERIAIGCPAAMPLLKILHKESRK